MCHTRRTVTALLALAAGVLAGCVEQNAPITAAPAFNFINGPTNPGPIVLRVTSDQFGGFVFIGVDLARQLVSVNNLGSIEPAQSVICGGEVSLDVVDFQVLFRPSGPLGLLVQGQDVTQHVYDLNEGGGWFNQGGLCAALELPRLAQGRGRFRFNDNNGDLATGHTDSFGWRAEGTLDDVAHGGQVRYTEEQRAIFLPSGEFKGFVVENILLRPVGGR